LYQLKPVLYEYSNKIEENYLLVAVVNKKEKIRSIYGMSNRRKVLQNICFNV
jgi:hypothetical protein